MNETLPNALSIGVDYETFWGLNPKTLSPFVKAFSIRQKYDDAMNWSLGSYIKMAIASAFNKSAKYPDRPLLESELSTVSEVHKQRDMQERIKAHAIMLNESRKRGIAHEQQS